MKLNQLITEESIEDVYLTFVDTELAHDAISDVFKIFGYKEQGVVSDFGITEEDMEELNDYGLFGPGGNPAVDDIGVWAKTKPTKQRVIRAIKNEHIGAVSIES